MWLFRAISKRKMLEKRLADAIEFERAWRNDAVRLGDFATRARADQENALRLAALYADRIEDTKAALSSLDTQES